MFLDTSALYLLERHRAFEADLERGALQARQRAELRFAGSEDQANETTASGRIDGVVLGDRPGGRSGLRADVGGAQHLDPTPCTEQHAGRFVRPIHP
jgi:hypothetical protein